MADDVAYTRQLETAMPSGQRWSPENPSSINSDSVAEVISRVRGSWTGPEIYTVCLRSARNQLKTVISISRAIRINDPDLVHRSEEASIKGIKVWINYIKCNLILFLNLKLIFVKSVGDNN